MNIKTRNILILLIISAFCIDLMYCNRSEKEKDLSEHLIEIDFEKNCVLMSNFNEIYFRNNKEEIVASKTTELKVNGNEDYYFNWSRTVGGFFDVEILDVFGNRSKGFVEIYKDTIMSFEDILDGLYVSNLSYALIDVNSSKPITIYYRHPEECKKSGSVLIYRDETDRSKVNVLYHYDLNRNNVEHFIVKEGFIKELYRLEVSLSQTIEKVDKSKTIEKIAIITGGGYYNYLKEFDEEEVKFMEQIQHLISKYEI